MFFIYERAARKILVFYARRFVLENNTYSRFHSSMRIEPRGALLDSLNSLGGWVVTNLNRKLKKEEAVPEPSALPWGQISRENSVP